jgi:NAD(P) transhydrogenase
MGDFEYDLLVIGGGPAGEKGAAQAAYFGYKTILIEKESQLGGACINTGTLASKTLRESALFLSGFKSRQLYGLQANIKRDIPLADFMYRRNLVQERERERATENLRRHQIQQVHGHASLVDAHTVLVKTIDGTQRRITAKFILIATGSVPHRPSEIPFNPDTVFDSDTVLQMKNLPRSMLIIGGGVIGCEYACLFAALGIQVILVDGRDRLLPFLDSEITDLLTARMRELGIELATQDGLGAAHIEGNHVFVELKSGKEIVTESLLYVAGRSGNSMGLGLEKIGITIGKRGHVEVNPITYQTIVSSVYAVGDVVGFPALASTSMEQARIAVCHAFDLKYKTQLASLLPYGIYTIPEVSSVGDSEESCREKKIAFVVGKNRFGQHARGQIIGDLDGMIKLIVAVPSGKILGVHVIGEMASELVHVGQAAMHFEGTIDFFIQAVFNYPTLGDVYKYAAYDALGKLNELRKLPAASG